MKTKTLKLITQILLLSVIVIVPFLFTKSLYFPFISGKVYVFRLLVALAFFFWVWLILKEKSYIPNFRNFLVIAVVLFFLAQILASFFGVDPVLSFFSSIERADGVLQYGFWLLYFLMLTSVFRKEKDWKMFFSFFVIVAVLVSLYSWHAHFWQDPDSLYFQPQLSGVFGNPAYFAAYLLFALGFSLLLFERKFFHSRFINNLFLVAAGFFIITLIFTQIRGAYAGLTGGIFLFCLLSILFLRGEEDKSSSSTLHYARVKENRKLAYSCGIVLLLGLVFTTVLFAAKDTGFVKENRLLYRITEIVDFWESDSARERLLNWNIAFKAFKEKPVFGWGPENFGSAANKYYDYRVGRGEPWFDRAHNQPMDTLATGGIVVFSFYLFWLAAALFLIFRIARPSSRISAGSPSANKIGQSPAEISLPGKEKKLLSFILASIFLAYFLQGFFLFDLLAVYLGLFPFLAYLVAASRQPQMTADSGNQQSISGNLNFRGNQQSSAVIRKLIIVAVGVFSVFLIYTTVFMPYKANAAAFQFLVYTQNGLYKEARPFLETAFNINSPYTFWEVRKRAGWQFNNILEYEIWEGTEPEKIKEIKDMYEFFTLELERFIENRPYDPQVYYVLGRVYRFGYEKLGYDDLDKAETVFRKALGYSDLRADYFNEFAKVLLSQGKFEEAEELIKDYLERVTFYEYFPYLTLGHFYFVAMKYDLAWEQYEKAREVGYLFYENETEYARYMFVAEQMGEYQKIVDMAKNFLEKWGEDADTYFNIAVGHLNLEEKEKAKEFFLKALELKPEYEEYRAFFTE